MRRIASTVLLATVVVAIGCGGGGSQTAFTPPPPPPAQAYLPLAVGNTWNYDCGNQVTITDTVTQTETISGQQTFALELPFPNAPTQTFLLANDAKQNTKFYGYLVNGTPMSVTPTPYISANPTASEAFDYPAQNGGTVDRVFVTFENTNPTLLGTFQVASYNDNGKQDIWGYALGKGIMEQDHGSFDCKITSFQLH
jgi:hypothetical protein